MIEVLHHWDRSKNTGSRTDRWILHGAIFLVTFGPRTHDIHPGTRERQEHRYTGEQIDYYSIVHESRRNMHGITTVVTQEDDLDDIETYREIADSHDPPVRGYPESYVQRMGLAECRVLCMHINSYAYHYSRQRVREELRAIFSKALWCMVDFICGDFNQFANRQFSRETGGSIFGGIVLEVLEDAIRATNQQLWRENWITFNISSSSAPQDVFDSVFANNHNDMDCMLCISLFYNKQKFQVERPPVLTNEFTMSHDYIHSVSERPRQLTVYDLCLKATDADWHSPLLVRVNSHALKNKRTRGPGRTKLSKSTISRISGTEQLVRRLESTKPILRRQRRTIHFPIFIIELERTKMARTTMGRLVWRLSLNRYNGWFKHSEKANRYNGSCTCLLKM